MTCITAHFIWNICGNGERNGNRIDIQYKCRSGGYDWIYEIRLHNLLGDFKLNFIISKVFKLIFKV